MKRFIFLFLIIFLFSACSQSNSSIENQINSQDSPHAVAVTDEVTEPETKIDYDPIKLRFTKSEGSSVNDNYQNVIDVLNNNGFSVSIEIYNVPSGVSSIDVLRQKINAGVSFDAAGFIGSPLDTTDGFVDFLLPVQDLIQSYAPYIHTYCSTNQYYKHFVEGDESYVVPTNFETLIPNIMAVYMPNDVFYEFNKDITSLTDYFKLCEIAKSLYPEEIGGDFVEWYICDAQSALEGNILNPLGFSEYLRDADDLSSYVFPHELKDIDTIFKMSGQLIDDGILFDGIGSGMIYMDKYRNNVSLIKGEPTPNNNAYTVLPLIGANKYMNYEPQVQKGFILPVTNDEPQKVMMLFDFLLSDKENYQIIKYGKLEVDFDIEDNKLVALSEGNRIEPGDKFDNSCYEWIGSEYFDHIEYNMDSIYDFNTAVNFNKILKPVSPIQLDIIAGVYDEDKNYFISEEFALATEPLSLKIFAIFNKFNNITHDFGYTEKDEVTARNFMETLFEDYQVGDFNKFIK